MIRSRSRSSSLLWLALAPTFATALTTAALASGCSSGDAAPSDDAASQVANPSPETNGNAAGSGGDDENKATPPASSAGEWRPPSETGAVRFPYKAYRCEHVVRQVDPARASAIFHKTGQGARPEVRNLHLTFAGDASRSVTFGWSTDDRTVGTEVQFGDSPDKLDKTARGYSFTYGVSDRRQHEVHLCGLEPGHTYYYRAGAGSAMSPVYHFVTAPDGPSEVSVLALGDTRSQPGVLTTIEPKALAAAPDVMVFSGDAVNQGSSQSQWDDLFESAPELFATVPAYWAHGNHEGLNELYFAQLALPDHGDGDVGIEEWYSAAYGPFRLVVLNDTVSSASVITGVERTFLQKAVSGVDRSRTPFSIAMHHQPMYTTSSKHGSNTKLRAAWGPLFDEHHVDLDLAGHVHSYELSKPLTGGTATEVGQVTDDARGTRYATFGGGGAPLYPFTGTMPSWLVKRESTHGFAMMTVASKSLTWKAFRQDGSVIETATIQK